MTAAPLWSSLLGMLRGTARVDQCVHTTSPREQSEEPGRRAKPPPPRGENRGQKSGRKKEEQSTLTRTVDPRSFSAPVARGGSHKSGMCQPLSTNHSSTGMPCFFLASGVISHKTFTITQRPPILDRCM